MGLVLLLNLSIVSAVSQEELNEAKGLIYSNIAIDLLTLIASIGVLIIFILIIHAMRYIIPKVIELDEDEYKERDNAPEP